MFGGEIVFRRVGLRLLELKLQLVEQPRRALGARSINRAAQLLDLKIEMRNQRAPVSRRGSSAGQFGADSAAASARAAISAAFSASMSSGREERSASTNQMESQNRTFEAPLFAFLQADFFFYPTAVGRHVSCGMRQSMPDRR